MEKSCLALDKGLWCRVHLQDQDVARRVIVYLSVNAYVQAIVRHPLDSRRSLEKDIDRVIPLEFVNNTPFAKRKHMFIKLHLIR